MLIGHNLAFEASCICVTIIDELVHIGFVKHSVVLLEMIHLYRFLPTICVIAVAFVIYIGLPFSKIVLCGSEIKVLFSCSLVVMAFILGSLH